MENLPGEDGYEAEFIQTLLEYEEVVIPYFEAATFVQSIDKTSAYIMDLLEKNDLLKIGSKYSVCNGRYTEEHGHHFWVRMWDPRG